MKMVMAGNWQWPFYQQACANALAELGVNVVAFKWQSYFHGIMGKFEAHTLIGISRIRKLNNDLIKLCSEVKPDMLFVWGAMHIKNATLEKIKRMGVYLISYNNDDPFAKRYTYLRYFHLRKIWRNFIRNLPLYQMNFVYRQKNIDDYRKIGINNVHILPSYYCKDLHFPMNLERGRDFDGVFLGHYENDERFECINALRESAISVEVFGTGWDKCEEDKSRSFSSVKPALGAAYNQTLNRAHFALCFFSKLNNDDYTRRVFEIPATGTLLVCKRTDEMMRLYKDGEEAIFFDDSDELVSRMTGLIKNPKAMKTIAERGHRHCLSSPFDVKSRMGDMLAIIETSRNNSVHV